MKTSFMDTLKVKESAPKAETVAPELTAQAEPAQPEEVTEEAPLEDPEEVKAEPRDYSDEVKKQLAGNNSFMDKVKAKEEAERLKREQEILALEQEQEEEEQEEEEPKQEEAPQPVSFTVGDQTFESLDQVNEHLVKIAEQKAELEQEVEQIRDFVQKISDPDTLSLLRLVREGYSLPAALVKAGFDESIFQAEYDEQTNEQLIRAKLEREQQAKEQQKLEAELIKNMEASNRHLQEFQTSRNLDETAKNKLVGLMTKVYADLQNGLVTPETLEIFAKGLNYEKAVEEAAKVAEIKVKNEKIEERKAKREQVTIPSLGRSGISNASMDKPKPLREMVTVPSNNFMDKIKNRQAQK